MMRFYRPGLLFALAVLATILCGCPPLNYKIYTRNTTLDTAHLILIYDFDDDSSDANIKVRSKNQILPINKKTISLLNDTLTAFADSGKITLAIPPKSTVFLTDIIRPVYISHNKFLIIQHLGKSDTIAANYPYRHLKDFKLKSDPSYNYFYRTIIYYDIK